MTRNFRFQLYLCATTSARRPLASISERPGHGWTASAARLPVPPTCLLCFVAFGLRSVFTLATWGIPVILGQLDWLLGSGADFAPG